MMNGSLVLVLVLAVTIVGCRRPSRAPGAGSTDSAENQAALGKLKSYLGCLNDHSARVFQIADAYAERMGGQPPSTTSKLVIQASPSPAKCLEAIDTAGKDTPSLPALESAGGEFAKALATVFKLTAEAHDAWDPGNPKSYDPAKGVALHPQLVAAFAAFDTAQAALFDQVYQINRKVHVDQLTRSVQRNGRKAIQIVDGMLLVAEDLVRTSATPWNRLDALDLTTLSSGLETLENTLEELSTLDLSDPDDTASVARFPVLMKLARSYLVAGKQLARRARDQVAYTEAEKIMIGANNEASVVGTPAAMADAYNRLVEDYTQP